MVEYVCDDCNKTFPKKSNYERHNDRKYPCNPKLARERQQLELEKQKKEQAQKDKQNEFICNDCQSRFTRNSSLKRHLDGRCSVKQEEESNNLIEIQGKDYDIVKNENGVETIKLIFATMTLKGIKDDNKKLWFKGKDCATILEYDNTKKAINDHVNKEYILNYEDLLCTIKGNETLHLVGNQKNTKWINESGLYQLATKSKMPLAKKFQKWIFEEVLPQIRRTGKYDILENCFFDDHQIKDYKNTNVNYIGYVGTYDGEDYYKYGYTDNYIKREAAHLRDYDNFIVKYVGKCLDNKGIESEFERHLNRHKIRRVEVINKKKHKELFITTKKYTIDKLIDKMDHLITKHNKKYLKDSESNENVEKIECNKEILLVEQEKTKQEKEKSKQKIMDLLASGKISEQNAMKLLL